MTLADYLTLKDGAIRINGSPDPNAFDLYFDLPNDFVKGTNKAKPMLQFKVIAHQPTELEIWINGYPNVELDISLGEHKYYRTLHELLNGSVFIPGESNTIKFILADHPTYDTSKNDVTISDVVLFFQRSID